MNMLWGLVKGGASALVPGAGITMKLGPWVIIAVLVGLLLILRADLGRAQAQITTAQTQTAQAVDRCQKEAAVQVAAESAASAAAVAKAEATANAATFQLMIERQAAASAQAQRAQVFADTNSQIDRQAAQPGQDGPIPPVLAEEFP
ncbi:MAG TPA: hypothetical protein PLT25_02170 [Acidocella sp.]|nr:hypothetical protein [Acidocella sp.]